jgi:hypothetical protein
MIAYKGGGIENAVVDNAAIDVPNSHISLESQKPLTNRKGEKLF